VTVNSVNAHAANPATLPQLREDIRLLPDQRATAGQPRWLIHDILRDSFYEIGLEAFHLISLWANAKSAQDLARQVLVVHGRSVDESEIAEFSRFLSHSRLTLDQPGGWRELNAAAEAQKGGLAHQALHNYLFFKIPLVSPAVFLEKTLPLMRVLISKSMIAAYAIITLLGLYFVSRQWGDLTDGLQRQMNLSGAMLFAITLFGMKIFHELGHAYVATALGCRVRSMGLAVMMMAPMLYTDVTNAWQIQDRKKRMAIDLAGVAVELVIAGMALFLWAFTPPGDGRDVLLVIATAAVAMTLAVNLSPFMRFDGYYVFADLIGVKNLQPRAFALVRWKLREWLFTLGAPCPDVLRGGLRTVVIVYGIATMIYRLVLFTGIALLVYHTFFKLLGILLFLVEIVVFVARPVWREIKVWWSLRTIAVKSPRTWISSTVFAGLVIATVVPWSTQVHLQAVLEPAHYVRLFPSVPSEIKEVHMTLGQKVTAGTVLVVMASTRLEKEMSIANARLALVEERMGRRLGDAKDQAATLSLEKDRASLIEKKIALQRQIDSLSIHASIDGVVAEMDTNLHVGRLLSREDEIGILIGGDQSVIRGYADQQDLWRLKNGDQARFIPDDGHSTILTASIAGLTPSASTSIDIPQLSETHGGKVRTHPPQPKSGLIPIDPIHLVTLHPETNSHSGERTIRGTVLVDGAPQSIAASLWRRMLKVLVQETGA
jgi:putative peptide zinc metalloprotease protein